MENKAEVDEKIMQELLDQKKIKKQVKKMNQETLEWFKQLLVISRRL